MTRRGALLFVGLGLAWGIPYLLIKVAVDELSPIVLVFARTSLAAVLLVPIAFAKGAVRPVLSHWRMLVVYSVAEIVVPWLFLTHAEQRLSSSLAGLLIAAVPLASVGVAFVSGRREHLGRIGVLGLLVGFAGVAFLVGVDVHGSALSAVAEMAVRRARLRHRRHPARPLPGPAARARRRRRVVRRVGRVLRAVRHPAAAALAGPRPRCCSRWRCWWWSAR